VRALIVIALTAFIVALPLAAQEQDTTEIARLRRQIEAVTRELERLSLGTEVAIPADTPMRGLGPAASKVYRSRGGASIAGYGEFVFDRFAARRQDGSPSNLDNRLDALRAIVYLGYRFDDRFLFNSEIEFEHGSTDDGVGEVAVEFAYLEARVSPALGFRGGLLLVPMGWINERHEPPTFFSVRRPETEQRVLPSTWRENGLGVFGDVGPVTYRAYLLTGFDAVGDRGSVASGFGAAGLRGGRQSGARALAEDWAGVARVDLAAGRAITVGVSAYLGQAGQNATVPGGTLGARTFIGDGHAEFRSGGLWARGVAALATVDQAAEINALKGLTGSASVGERLVGWYVEAGYDVLRHVRTGQALIPFVRYESLNTQDRVPAGFAADPANDLEVITLGGMWKPIPQVAVKADYQLRRNAARTGVDQLGVGLAYLF
jgi:hypothetical protein